MIKKILPFLLIGISGTSIAAVLDKDRNEVLQQCQQIVQKQVELEVASAKSHTDKKIDELFSIENKHISQVGNSLEGCVNSIKDLGGMGITGGVPGMDAMMGVAMGQVTSTITNACNTAVSNARNTVSNTIGKYANFNANDYISNPALKDFINKAGGAGVKINY